MRTRIDTKQVFDDCRSVYLSLRARDHNGGSSILGGSFAEAGVVVRALSRPVQTDRATEYISDFEVCGKLALRFPTDLWSSSTRAALLVHARLRNSTATEGRQRAFTAYCLEGLSYSDSIARLGVNPNTFDGWLREIKKSVGELCLSRGLWPIRYYFGRIKHLSTTDWKHLEQLALDRRRGAER